MIVALSHVFCVLLLDLSVRVPNAFGYLPFYYLEFVLDAFGPLMQSPWPKFSFMNEYESGTPLQATARRDCLIVCPA